MRIRILVAALFVILAICGVSWHFSRTREFKAQAQAGQPIVRAIDDFQRRTGSYPSSLADLVPAYLPTIPDQPDRAKHKFIGWDYQKVTIGRANTYLLRYYMGRGGIEYVPPEWTAIDEGTKTVIMSNE